MKAKYSTFLNMLKKEVRQMNVKISHPVYQIMEYIKKADVSFNRIEFQKAYHNLLNIAGIKDKQVACDIKWAMFIALDLSTDLRCANKSPRNAFGLRLSPLILSYSVICCSFSLNQFTLFLRIS